MMQSLRGYNCSGIGVININVILDDWGFFVKANLSDSIDLSYFCACRYFSLE